MKTKILSIALLSVMLLTLFVPLNAFASEDNSIVGTWVLNDTLNFDLLELGTYYQFEFYVIGYHASGEQYISNYKAIRYKSDYLKYCPNSSSTTNSSTVYQASTNVWDPLSTTPTGYFKTIYITTECDDIAVFNWLNANGKKQTDDSGNTPDTDTGTGDTENTPDTDTGTNSNLLGYRTFKTLYNFDGVPTHSTLEQAKAQAEIPENCIKVKFPLLNDTNTYYLYPFYFYNIDNKEYGYDYYDCYCVFVWATDGTTSSSPKDFYIDGFCYDEEYDNHWVYGFDNIKNFILLEQSNEVNTTWVNNNSTANSNYFVPKYPDAWDKDAYKYGFILRDLTNDITYFYAYNKKFTANADKTISMIGSSVGVKYVYNQDTATWTLSTVLEVEDGDTVTFNSPLSLVWSNYTIYYEDGQPFFPLTPHLTLTTGMMKGVMTEIVEILPVGLLCLIGYLGLRKGLKILVQVLRQA